MSMYHENGAVPKPHSKVKDWLFNAAGVLSVVALLGMAYAIDNGPVPDMEVEGLARQEQQLLAVQERIRTDTQIRIMQAYERGLSDGLESFRSAPEGVALVQACAALKDPR